MEKLLSSMAAEARAACLAASGPRGGATRPQPTWGEEYLNSENKFDFHWSIMLSTLMYSTLGNLLVFFILLAFYYLHNREN